MKDILEKVEKLIASAKVSFIGSVDEDDFPNLKAMLPPRKRQEAALCCYCKQR